MCITIGINDNNSNNENNKSFEVFKEVSIPGIPSKELVPVPGVDWEGIKVLKDEEALIIRPLNEMDIMKCRPYVNSIYIEVEDTSARGYWKVKSVHSDDPGADIGIDETVNIGIPETGDGDDTESCTPAVVVAPVLPGLVGVCIALPVPIAVPMPAPISKPR
ncbi:MAG: hypothetical protein GY765_26265 [bacterium]|nr:hypothetical protein [bacterium]